MATELPAQQQNSNEIAIHIRRSPYHALRRALDRENRLISKINRAIERGSQSTIDQLFRVYFDNIDLQQSLLELLRGDDTVKWSH